MKIEIGDLPFIKAPNWTPIHKLKNHTDNTLNPFFKLDPILYKLKTPHTKCSPRMPKCELKILPKCSPCLPKQKKTPKSLESEKLTHLKINIVKTSLPQNLQ
jgi:hypothetical protein